MTEEKQEAVARWNDPEVIEAIRLINKFFPESEGYVSPESGISFGSFIGAMRLAEFGADYSCEYFGIPAGPDLGLEKKGGFNGDHIANPDELCSFTGIINRG